jgi:hypothetical protein
MWVMTCTTGQAPMVQAPRSGADINIKIRGGASREQYWNPSSQAGAWSAGF